MHAEIVLQLAMWDAANIQERTPQPVVYQVVGGVKSGASPRLPNAGKQPPRAGALSADLGDPPSSANGSWGSRAMEQLAEYVRPALDSND